MVENSINTVLPSAIQPGDTIGIAAPAGSFKKAMFNKGIEALRGMGYHPFIPNEIYDQDVYFAGPDKQRAETLNRLFANPDIKAIMCARGGYGAMRMLSYLDFQSIREHPKLFVGFSDVSALLWTLYARVGLIGLHGPTITTLAEANKTTISSLDMALRLDLPIKVVPQAGRTIHSGSASGRIVGGNLTTLSHLMGTCFSPNCGGCILLIEDHNEAPYRVDRMLSQIRLSGWFQKIAGVVVGSFENCGNPRDIDQIVAEVFGELGIPVLGGIDVGHGKTNLTLPVGLEAHLDADEKFIEIGMNQ